MSYWQRKYSLFIRLKFCIVQEFSNLQTIFHRNHFLQTAYYKWNAPSIVRPYYTKNVLAKYGTGKKSHNTKQIQGKYCCLSPPRVAIWLYLYIWHFRTIRVFICMFVSRLSEDYFPASVYEVKLHLSELVGTQTVHTIRVRIARARHKNRSSRSDKWMQAAKLLIQLIGH